MADEVEAHLWDAAEADPAWPSADAERRAVDALAGARDRRAIRRPMRQPQAAAAGSCCWRRSP
jgi:hypothetical protein